MVEKRLRGVLGISLLSLMTGACTEATPSEKPRDAVGKTSSTARLDGLQVVAAEPDGVPTFINGPLGAVPTETGAVHSIQAAQLRPVLEGAAPLFRLKPDDLYLKKAYVGFDGDAHFRYGVRRNGIDVLGGELRLHARNGAVFAANTNARGDLLAPERATVAPEAAVTAAKLDRSSPPGATATGEPRLVYWRDGDQLVLAYEVRVQGTGADGAPLDDSVLVNARNGDVFERLPHIHSALYRRVYDGDGGPGRIEGDPPVANPLVNIAYDHLGTVYRCYNELFGRDSYDNAGAHLISTVYHRNHYVNIYWDGTQLVLGDGGGVTPAHLAGAVDVMAHEVTHGVTETESDLLYSGESGGLNESISDIFGAVCEWHSKGKVVDANTWLFGEDVWTPDIPGDAIRYMHNPKLDGNSLDNYFEYLAGADVHFSSGIPNLAFYLLSQGGLHPRIPNQSPVTGIGIEKAARIFYKANVDLLLPSSNFQDAKNATEQAAFQLGYDSETLTSVTRAWWAVKVGVPHVPPDSELEKDVPVQLSGAQGRKFWFFTAVPEGVRDLKYTLTGGTGDADLYVRFNTAPTTTLYDCRPYKSGNEEECLFPAPAQGSWWVMVNGFSAYADVTLKVTWKGGYVPLQPGVEVTGLSGAAGSSRVFTVQIPEREDGGTRNIHARLRGSGNADLYVQRAAAPTPSAYDCRGIKEHSTENCDLNGAEPGRYYVEVFGAKGGYSDGSLIVTYD
ncbi:M4 family metallopeptidase [Pyxidicoccus sp. MSG2]|uniref:M4 family metallopeptidase n=1 Tax=Pyxidicoccus sp. MSG2 TaxID=2996790 RepID=UPI00226DCDD8|nr:M4 family metallopeptidase [Pyxidicoccus sp. MSG2]MCY1020324.1 M4 family metallopeptidase [Pyxidicoccus sp. MSG2]